MWSSFEPYSFRFDPSVPGFDDANDVAVMRGDSAFCSFGARMIARIDKSGSIKICSIQTDLAHALLKDYDIDLTDPEAWLFVADGRAECRLTLESKLRKLQRNSTREVSALAGAKTRSRLDLLIARPQRVCFDWSRRFVRIA